MKKIVQMVFMAGAVTLVLTPAHGRNSDRLVGYQEIAERTCNKQPKGAKRNACFTVELKQLSYNYDDIYDALESSPKSLAAFEKAVRQKDYINILKYYRQGYSRYGSGTDDLIDPN